MRVGLAQSNLDNGYELLIDVSNPESPNFGKHWTSEQVIEAFRPSQETEEEKRQWLIENGIPAKRITLSDNKGWFAFCAIAKEAERLLHTEYHEYEDAVTGGVLPACDAYHLPKRIRRHIDYITPGIKLLAPVESHRSKKAALRKKLAKKDVEVAKESISARTSIIDLLEVEEESVLYDPNDLSTCDVTITPACVAALYDIPKGHSHHPGNSMGIFQSELQFNSQEDLNLFFTNFTSYIANGTHPIPANIDGGQQATDNPSQVGAESNLDLMLAYPIIYPQTITLYQVDDLIVQANSSDTYYSGFKTFLGALDGSYCSFSAYNETGNDPNLDPIYPDPNTGGWKGQLMCGVYKPTNVISLSYGGQESDLPTTYQKRQCLEYMKLGLQDVSFVFASSDSGVSSYPASVGGTDGPTGCIGANLNVFSPTWPDTCPFVTSVGGTKVDSGKSVFEPESVLTDPVGHPFSVNLSSGGGFSNIYPIPKYQASAVSTFFTKYNPPHPYYSALSPDMNGTDALPNIDALVGLSGGVYNRIGRGIPDVSANGNNIANYKGRKLHHAGGTSASAPIFSAVINRINDARLNVGKGPLGFLNPSLYANPSMLNDITNGSNHGCDTVGFSAVPGWNPVTGLGTPNYPNMLRYYMSLP